MKQATPVRPLDAQRNGCSGVVDTTAGLQQAKSSEVPTQPLSSDRQVSEEKLARQRSAQNSEPDALIS